MDTSRYAIADGTLSLDEIGNIHVYISPNETEIKQISKTFGLDEYSIASALDPDELARVDFDENYLEVILKRPNSYCADKFVFRVTSIGMFLIQNDLIIILPEAIPLFKSKHYAKISSLKELMLKMMWSSILHFTEHLKIINDISNSLEDQINASMQNKCLLNLFGLEKSLVYYLNAISSNGMLIERLKHASSKLNLLENELELLDNLIIENNQCYKQAEIYSNILASLMDARASIVSNNLNWLMKTLTIITIGIMLPTLVVSIFSMNVDFPFKNHPLAFWGIIGLALMSIVSVRLVWWWKKW